MITISGDTGSIHRPQKNTAQPGAKRRVGTGCKRGKAFQKDSWTGNGFWSLQKPLFSVGIFIKSRSDLECGKDWKILGTT